MLKSLRRYYWLTQVFIRKHKKIIIRSTTVVLSILTAIILSVHYLPTPKHTVKIGRVGKYTLSSIPQDIATQISEGLVHLDSNGQIEPALAKSWQIMDGGTKYVFTLDTSKQWSDGTKISGYDINYNFSDVTVEKSDDTVTFTLKEPYAPFMSAMTKPIMKNNILGTQTTRISSYKLISGAIETLTLESPSVRYLYKFYPTDNSAITAYKLGEVTVLDTLSSIPTELLTDTSSNVTTSQGDKIAALFMNNADSLLSSKTTRQGLAYAIPDKSFGKTRALSPISSNNWAYNDLVKDYQFDPERAKSLFTQDVQDPGNVKLELKTMLQYLDIAESIAENWRQTLGINVEVKVISSFSSDYQVILADFTPPLDPDQYTLWHSTQATNFTKYSNLKVDKLLEDGRRTQDLKLRKDIYQDFQRFLLEDSPAIFLFQTDNFTITRKPL